MDFSLGQKSPGTALEPTETPPLCMAQRVVDIRPQQTLRLGRSTDTRIFLLPLCAFKARYKAELRLLCGN